MLSSHGTTRSRCFSPVTIERRHLHALAVGLEILALRQLGAPAHAARSGRRPRHPPSGSDAGRQPRARMGIQRPQLSPSAASRAEHEQRTRKSGPSCVSCLAGVQSPTRAGCRHEDQSANTMTAHGSIAQRDETTERHTAEDGVGDARCIEDIVQVANEHVKVCVGLE